MGGLSAFPFGLPLNRNGPSPPPSHWDEMRYVSALELLKEILHVYIMTNGKIERRVQAADMPLSEWR